jgi:hypothetical protein
MLIASKSRKYLGRRGRQFVSNLKASRHSRGWILRLGGFDLFAAEELVHFIQTR